MPCGWSPVPRFLTGAAWAVCRGVHRAGPLTIAERSRLCHVRFTMQVLFVAHGPIGRPSAQFHGWVFFASLNFHENTVPS